MQGLAIQLHYKCIFDIKQKDTSVPEWGYIVREIRDWISSKISTDQHFEKKWYFNGGTWSPQRARYPYVTTDRFIGNGTENEPECWALRFEHPCFDVKHRIWRSDVGLSKVSQGQYRFAMLLGHWFQAGTFQDEPLPPSPSSPIIIRRLIDFTRSEVSSGNEILLTYPVELQVGNGNHLVERIKDFKRECPIVYVSRTRQSNECLLDSRRLAQLVAGSAVVYVAGSTECDDELEYLLPQQYRCYDGMVRVYMPKANFERANDFKRHRFFHRRAIETSTPEKVGINIVSELVRRIPSLSPSDIVSIESVTARQRVATLKLLKDSDQAEYVKVLEQVNTEQLQQIQQLEMERNALQVNLNKKMDEIATVKYERDEFLSRLDTNKAETKALMDKASIADDFCNLPKSVSEVIGRIQKIHSARVEFSSEAMDSAEDSTVQDMGVAWEILWRMATTLHELYFGGFRGNIEKEFNSKTGYELFLNEGRMTQKDKDLMKLRSIQHDGIEYDISAHVKYGNKPPKMIRVHYADCKVKKKLIIGFCGDHMENRTSRKRK